MREKIGNNNEKGGKMRRAAIQQPFQYSILDGRKLQPVVVEAEQRKAEEALCTEI